jgi:hypothetical protein
MSATVIVGWPLDDSRPEERYTFDAGTNLAEALMTISPDRWGGMSFTLFFGSVSAATEFPVADAADHTLAEGEVWHVAVCPADPVSGVIIAGVMAMGASKAVAMVVAYAAMTAISMAVSFAASMLLAPGKQNEAPIAPSDQPTGLNAMTPPRNTIRPAGRIPEIFGRMRHWPDLIFPASQDWAYSHINADWGPMWASFGGPMADATAIQHVWAVYCLGRGTLHAEDFRFGDTEIGAAGGSVEWYPPGHTLPDWIKLPRPVVNLSRTEFPGGRVPDPWLPWVTIPGETVSEIWFQVSAPGGINLAGGGKGVTPGLHYLPTVAEFAVECHRLDQWGNVVEAFPWRQNLPGRTLNEIRHTFKIAPVTPGRWRVRIAEIGTHEPPTTVASRRAALEGIIGYEWLGHSHRTHADETILVVHAHNRGGTAIQNLENFNCKVVRQLPVPDPHGNMTAPHSNPHWITAAAFTLLDPQTCAYSHDQIDWHSLWQVHAALEQRGESQFNAVLDRQMSADEQLQLIARKARAQVFISGGLVTFARDQRRPAISALFNRRNRMTTRGGSGLGLRLPGPDDHDAVEIQWIDAANDYKQRTYTWPEWVTPINPNRIDLVGAVHWHEVYRRARYEHALMRYRRRTQPLRVTEEAELLLPFDRVAVVNPWDEQVTDGEVLQVDGWFLRLDRPVPPMGAQPGIRLRGADGRETALLRFEAAPARGPDWIQLLSAPPFTLTTPSPDQQIGTLFNISQHDAADAATRWLVTGAEIDEGGVTLSLTSDDDRIYAEADDVAVPPPPRLMETY